MNVESLARVLDRVTEVETRLKDVEQHVEELEDLNARLSATLQALYKENLRRYEERKQNDRQN